MQYSRTAYTADGTATDYAIPFPFLGSQTIEVYVGGIRRILGTDYFLVGSTIQFPEPPPEGATIRVKRKTPRGTSERVVVFYNGNHLPEETLNNATLQLLFIIQEIIDDIGDGTLKPETNSGGGTGSGTELEEALNDLLLEVSQLSTQIETEHNERVAALDELTDQLLGDLPTLVDELIEQSSTLDSAVASRIAVVAAQVAANKAAVEAEQITRASADSANAANVAVVRALVDDPETGLAKAHAKVTEEQAARVAADSALSSSIEVVAAQVNSPTTGLAVTHAKTLAEEIARATADHALGVSIEAVEAQMNDPETGLPATLSKVTEEAAARASADTALAVRASAIETAQGATNARITEVEAAMSTADLAISQRVTNLEAAVSAPEEGVAARLQHLEEVIASGETTEALALRVDGMEAEIDDPATGLAKAHSKLAEEASTRATADTALSNRTTALESSVNDPTTGVLARIGTVETTFASKNYADAKKSEAISASVTAAAADATAKANNARTAAESAAAADASGKANTAKTEAITAAALDAQTKAAAAQAAAEAYALAKAQLAETTAKAHADGKVTAEEQRAIADATAKANAAQNAAITAAAADASAKANAAENAAKGYTDTKATTLTSLISEEASARATGDSANAQLTQTLQSSVNGLSGTVSQHSQTIAEINNGVTSLKAEHVLEVGAGGAIGGYKVTAYGGGTKPRSDFAVRADRFTLSNGEGTTFKTPFRVEGDTCFMDNVEVSGRLRASKIATDCVVYNPAYPAVLLPATSMHAAANAGVKLYGVGYGTGGDPASYYNSMSYWLSEYNSRQSTYDALYAAYDSDGYWYDSDYDGYDDAWQSGIDSSEQAALDAQTDLVTSAWNNYQYYKGLYEASSVPATQRVGRSTTPTTFSVFGSNGFSGLSGDIRMRYRINGGAWVSFGAYVATPSASVNPQLTVSAMCSLTIGPTDIVEFETNWSAPGLAGRETWVSWSNL